MGHRVSGTLGTMGGTISTRVAFLSPCGVSGGVLEPPLSSKEQNLSPRKAASRQDNFCSPAPGENAGNVGKQAIWKIPSHSSSLWAFSKTHVA